MSKISVLILMSFIAVSAMAQHPEEEKLKSTEVSRSEFIASKKMNELDKLYHDTFYGVTATGNIVDKKTLLGIFQNFNPKDVKVGPEKMVARVYNDAAIVSGWLVTRNMAGEVVQQSLFMHFYNKINGEWRIVAGQGAQVAEKK